MERNVGALTTRTLVAYYFNFHRLAKALSQYLPCVEHSSPLFSSGGKPLLIARAFYFHRPLGTLRSSLTSAVYSRSGSSWLLMT